MALNNSEAMERVIARANELSRAWRHFYLGIEHCFVAACKADGSLAEALSDVGVTLAELEEGILEFVPSSDDEPLWDVSDKLPETPRYRRLVKTMVPEEAEAVQALRIEPKHFVTAALREGRSVPCRFLHSRDIDLLALRDAIRGVKRSDSPASGGNSGGGGLFGRKRDEKLTPEGRKFAREHKMLLQYGRDLTELAREGKMDPVVGRNDEVRRVLQVLTRKTKSNPVLVGEAGVGKTSVAYGLAQRLAAGTVPDILKNRHVVELSLGALVAGTGHRGEFEKRLQQLIEELSKDDSTILFIDEIHQIVGAGGSGGMDAGNILKPAMARGDFAVMGATTTDEYRRYIEADPALERRFQQVMVSEPSEEDAFEILRGLRDRYEHHHNVHFTDEALLAAVKLSVRFLPDRNLPDKAIDLIDEAAARIKTRGDCQGNSLQEVTQEVISEVVADWTGIPVSRIANEEETRLLDMENLLRGRVVGQDHAVAAVASTIRVVRVGLSSPNRPGGVFLFLGPSGVGKTELAKTLAEFLFGSEREMIRLDMSEFHDKHSVARLIGAPPGYVGYEGEGQLTKAVRTKPFCVLLLDEVEKACPDVFDLFLQVFDDGRLTDAKGRTVNFTNAIIIMTSNLGSKKAIEEASAQVAAASAALAEATGDEGMKELSLKKNAIAELMPTDKGFVGQLDDMPEVYQAALRGHFRPEFLNRIDEIIVFKTLKREDLQGIVSINLGKSIKRIKDNRQVDLRVTKKAVEFLLDKGYHPALGARPLNRAIDTWLTRPFAEYVLRRKVPPNTVIWADVGKDESGEDELVFSPDSSAMGDTFGGDGGSISGGATGASDGFGVGSGRADGEAYSDGGYPPQSVSPGGYPPQSANQGGYPPQPMAPGGYPPQSANQGGYPPQPMAPGGYSSPSAPQGGYPPQPVATGGYSPQSPQGSYPSQASSQGGYPSQPMAPGGYPPQLPQGGYPPQSAVGGYNGAPRTPQPRNLQPRGGYSVSENPQGYPPQGGRPGAQPGGYVRTPPQGGAGRYDGAPQGGMTPPPSWGALPPQPSGPDPVQGGGVRRPPAPNAPGPFSRRLDDSGNGNNGGW